MHKITKILLTKPFVHVGLHRNITIQININKTNISYSLISVMLKKQCIKQLIIEDQHLPQPKDLAGPSARKSHTTRFGTQRKV